MYDVISASKNQTYKFIKSLHQKKARQETGCFTVEGIKSVSDAVKSDWKIKMLAVSESFYLSGEYEFYDGFRTAVIKDDIFGRLCDTKTPQGIIAVIEMKDNTHIYPDKSKLYVYCDNISDPGNLGTIIRTADAAGFTGVMISEGCADVYSPKTVRASMGSFFNIDIVHGADLSQLIEFKEAGFSLFSGVLSDRSIVYTEKNFTKPSVIIVGNEANGVRNEILSISEHIIIPIYGHAESLNVAVAAAIMMYEAANQRQQTRVNF